MFAIVNIKGKQYTIRQNQRLFVSKLSEKTGSRITFSDVLAYSKDGKILEVGTPFLKMDVKATVLNHIKDDKVIVFKKKRRKGYKRTRGHRQEYSEIEINQIGTMKAEGEAKPEVKSQAAAIEKQPAKKTKEVSRKQETGSEKETTKKKTVRKKVKTQEE